MGLRNYRVIINNKYWHSHKTIYGACCEVASRLKQINALCLIDKGTFEETYMFEKGYHKRYVIDVIFPPTKIEIRKLNKGDWNVVELMQVISYVQKVYNERI